MSQPMTIPPTPILILPFSRVINTRVSLNSGEIAIPTIFNIKICTLIMNIIVIAITIAIIVIVIIFYIIFFDAYRF